MIEEIDKLKKEKNAIILAHNYQPLEIQKIADFVGDSLELSQKAAAVECEIIVFCGVHFMAETAKLLSPKVKVLLPVKDAGCPMADMINGEQLRQFKYEYPGSPVVCYVNSTAEVKAESDVCCTSSNAVKIISSLPEDGKILFVPDQNLGQYAAKMTGREIVVWDGYCNVHHQFITLKDVKNKKAMYPSYMLIVHPECIPEILEEADFVASTKGIADFVKTNDNVIIGTEIGLIEQLKEKYPHKNLVPLSVNAQCVNMKKITIEDVYSSLLEEKFSISIEPEIAPRALNSLKRMLSLS